MRMNTRKTRDQAPPADAGGPRSSGAAGAGSPVDPPREEGTRRVDPQQLASLLGVLAGLFEKLPAPRRKPGVVESLSFADVVGYFTEQHPGDARIAAGAMVCRPHPRGTLVFLVFLDEQDRPCNDPSGAPYGKRMVAACLDDELLDRLNGKQLLIFR
jgi:hypothetical protein